MKICAIVCEFNPFHNGHEIILKKARELSRCDAVVCLMSGQFTQRGEMCRTDKYLRAAHAIRGGADAVAELPPSFAVAPAEIFAEGGVKLAAELCGDVTLTFGCEYGEKEDFIRAAEILGNESEEFKKVLANALAGGESYIRARESAFAAAGGKSEMLSSPNNILGIEYTSAAMKSGGAVDILPVRRVEGEVDGKFCSPAHSIRENDDLAKKCMPGYSYADFSAGEDRTDTFGRVCLDALYLSDAADLTGIFGCSEGLENRLKKLASIGRGYNELISAAAGKRYTNSRIRRILTSNLLKLREDETKRFLAEKIPVNLLAVKREFAPYIMPVVEAYSGGNGRILELMSGAYKTWNFICGGVAVNPREKTVVM